MLKSRKIGLFILFFTCVLSVKGYFFLSKDHHNDVKVIGISDQSEIVVLNKTRHDLSIYRDNKISMQLPAENELLNHAQVVTKLGDCIVFMGNNCNYIYSAVLRDNLLMDWKQSPFHGIPTDFWGADPMETINVSESRILDSIPVKLFCNNEGMISFYAYLNPPKENTVEGNEYECGDLVTVDLSCQFIGWLGEHHEKGYRYSFCEPLDGEGPNCIAKARFDTMNEDLYDFQVLHRDLYFENNSRQTEIGCVIGVFDDEGVVVFQKAPRENILFMQKYNRNGEIVKEFRIYCTYNEALTSLYDVNDQMYFLSNRPLEIEGQTFTELEEDVWVSKLNLD